MSNRAPAGSPWSPRQRYWLQALGHAVPRLAGADEELPANVEEAAAPAPAPVQSRPAAAMDRDIAPAAPRRHVPSAPAPVDAAAAPAARHGGMRRPEGLPDRLQLAVLRASGLPPADPRVQALLEQWPPNRLRGDAAAKRALWRLLRVLRRPA